MGVDLDAFLDELKDKFETGEMSIDQEYSIDDIFDLSPLDETPENAMWLIEALNKSPYFANITACGYYQYVGHLLH